jgi:hypothetical protein
VVSKWYYRLVEFIFGIPFPITLKNAIANRLKDKIIHTSAIHCFKEEVIKNNMKLKWDVSGSQITNISYHRWVVIQKPIKLASRSSPIPLRKFLVMLLFSVENIHRVSPHMTAEDIHIVSPFLDY